MNITGSRDRLAAFSASVVSVVFLTASFYGTDAEVYLFPRIVAVFVAVLAVILIYDAFKSPVSDDIHEAALVNWKALLPGLLVGVVYVLLLERLGFYACSFFAFFAICLIYGKRSLFDPRAFILKLSVTVATMIVLYVLFWKLLNVRTPTGILF